MDAVFESHTIISDGCFDLLITQGESLSRRVNSERGGLSGRQKTILVFSSREFLTPDPEI